MPLMGSLFNPCKLEVPKIIGKLLKIYLFSDLFRFVPGMLKFVLLCDTFTKHKSDLSREERQEIIQHCRKRYFFTYF